VTNVVAWFSRWPVTLRLPFVVALLMLILGSAVSEVILRRLQHIQQQQLIDLTSSYLDGFAASLADPVLRKDSWEAFNILDSTRRLTGMVVPVQTIVTDAENRILAAARPRLAPIGGAVPDEFRLVDPRGHRPQLRDTGAVAFAARPLFVERHFIGTLYVKLDIAAFLAQRHAVLLALIVSNALLTLFASLCGMIAMHRLMTPMRLVERRLTGGLRGQVRPIPAHEMPPEASEAGRLCRSYNLLAQAMIEREALLAGMAEQKRLASLGGLASGMAHEINNPLGGLFTAVDTLRVHGEKAAARGRALDLLERGLQDIRDVVRAALATYRIEPSPRSLRAADLEDMRLLIAAEVEGKALRLDWRNELPDRLPVAAGPVRQIALHLLLNACKAAPVASTILFHCTLNDRLFRVAVADAGPGLSETLIEALALAPNARPMPSGSGLGLWVTQRLSAELGGTLRAEPSPLGGASLVLEIDLRRVEAFADVA